MHFFRIDSADLFYLLKHFLHLEKLKRKINGAYFFGWTADFQPGVPQPLILLVQYFNRLFFELIPAPTINSWFKTKRPKRS